jgi:nicotinamide-nucleotide amidase
MADGALKTSGASVSVSITGIAGPGGATAGKAVGLVHIASGRSGYSTLHAAQQFSGDRATVRLQAVVAALELVQQQMSR